MSVGEESANRRQPYQTLRMPVLIRRASGPIQSGSSTSLRSHQRPAFVSQFDGCCGVPVRVGFVHWVVEHQKSVIERFISEENELVFRSGSKASRNAVVFSLEMRRPPILRPRDQRRRVFHRRKPHRMKPSSRCARGFARSPCASPILKWKSSRARIGYRAAYAPRMIPPEQVYLMPAEPMQSAPEDRDLPSGPLAISLRCVGLGKLEAEPGIEPRYTALQAAA